MTEPYAVPVPRGYRVGDWEVREPLATGAFGSVYAARRAGGADGRLPRTAALKFLPTGTGTPASSPTCANWPSARSRCYGGCGSRA